METKELFHPTNVSDDYYICCFSVLDAELFFRRGETKPKQDYSTRFDIEQIIKFTISGYEDYGEIDYLCASDMFFIYTKGVGAKPLSLLLRVVGIIQKHLLFRLFLVVSGVVTYSQSLQSSCMLSVTTSKMLVDFSTKLISVQPYILLDVQSLQHIVTQDLIDEFIQDNILFKSKTGLLFVNYFRFPSTLSQAQPIINYITQNHKNNTSKSIEQVLVFADMFNNTCSTFSLNNFIKYTTSCC